MTETTAPVPAATRARIALPFAIVTLVWGSTWLVIRDQLAVVPPAWSITYRFLIGGLAMLAYARLSGVSLRLGGRGQAMAALIGVCQFVLNFQFVYAAEHHVTSGLVAVVYALLILPNAVLGRIFLGQGLSRAFLLGSAVALCGVALLFRHEMATAAIGPRAVALGIVLAAIGVFFASVANVLQAGAAARAYPIASLIAFAMLWGVAVDAGWALATTGPPVIETRPLYVAGVLYLGLIGSAITFPLYFGVIRAIGPARAAYTSVLIPVIAMALSTIFEGYRWTVEAALGGALVGLGLAIALAARRR